ncbi:hypothetical protein LWI29_009221 [Acer saccharum]|uniref:MULE transposase domain-containing protein n=1 Tax=Acer saccharum TaxID=4024 RepID=A0AA39VNG2_ACESA|nr:hypothetical protein LWI29_009221 [Acer saccharum]
MFTNGTRHLDLNNEGHSRWHEADTRQTLNEEYNANDTYNNSDCKFHVSFAQGHVSTTPVMFDYNLVQSTDDLLHTELVSLQATYIIGKEFISVIDAEEFYKKHSYGMGFSMRKDMVSRDTHGLITIQRWTTIFGFGLLVDETIETYAWILLTFLEAMHEKCPISVVTDGDRALGKAISLVMPSAIRRLCSWHLERNVQMNVGDSEFTQAFTYCMLTYMMESKFETQWLKAIETFGVQQNE